jgi:uncharacterized membrane protein
VVEASLGYFINPIVNVLLGVLVLRERLNKAQWASVALAAAGVLWLTVLNGRLPWIALALAVSFAFYGLMRKTASLGALEGLALETLLLAPVVLPALAWWSFSGRGAMARGDLALDAWLVFGGPLTALPLILFAAGARRLPLATVGLLQYLSPTIQLALGVWVFHEPFDRARLLGFGFIWAGLALYSADGWRRSRREPAPSSAATRRRTRSRILRRCFTRRGRWASRPGAACTWATPRATSKPAVRPGCARWSRLTATSATPTRPTRGKPTARSRPRRTSPPGCRPGPAEAVDGGPRPAS